MTTITLVFALSLAPVSTPAAPPWPAPVAPAISGADGFVIIPGAVLPPERDRTYRAVFDATRAAEQPDQLVPALNMAGSELNGLGASHVPLSQANFVVVFHGPAVDGILDAAHYREKFHVDNPNLPVLAAMRKAGVQLYVCGQYLAFEHIDPHTLSPDVKVASDALIVLIRHQNDGYALMSF
jgi:intracellular sulfur oxidation DsrE/DsrF family protein